MGMTADQIRQTIDDLYAATGVGDFDRAATMLTDDFFVTEADGLPMAGVYRGRDALRDLYIRVMGMVDVVALDRHALMTGDACAVVHLSIRLADPTLEPVEVCEMFRFRGNKVCEIRPFYFDPATMMRAVAAKTATSAP
ncbi:nuclear transport factor 2 family protein [Sphingomonas sp.]|uniref:nuclear transport factor 2 family protein n=1 Tax=Sphingomonas sp. TaxID=28214 RepID=UPI0037521512